MGTLNMEFKIEQPIDSLVQVLSDSRRNNLEKAQAACFLAKMALANPDNQEAIAAAGGIPALVELLTAGSSDEHGDDAKQNAAGALWHLSEKEKNKVEIAKAGGIVLLVKLITGGTPGAKENAAGALRSMAHSKEHLKVAIAQAAGVAALVTILTEEDNTPQAKEYAAGALCALAQNNPANQNVIAEALDALVNLAYEGTVQAQKYAETLITDSVFDEEDSSEESEEGVGPGKRRRGSRCWKKKKTRKTGQPSA